MKNETSALNRRDFLKVGSLTGASIASGSLSVFFAQNARGQTVSNGSIRVAIIGDFGETSANGLFPVDRVGPMMVSWDPDFIISLGDNNYVLGQASTIDANIGKNFGDYIYPKGTSPNSGDYPYPSDGPKFNRFFPVLGNHDYADVANDLEPTTANIANSQPYLDYLTPALTQGSAPINLYNTNVTLPDGSNFSETPTIRYFDFVRGAVHFFMIDNCPATPYGRDADGVQGKWLQAQLAASTAAWKIVCFHEPPYTSATGGGEQSVARWPFQAWGADLVMVGHVHNYERMAKADPGKTSPTITYIVNGAGGFVPESGFETSNIVPGSKVRVQDYGAQLLEANENTLSLLYYDIDNNLRDSYTLFKDSGTGAPEIEFTEPQVTVADDANEVTLTVRRLGPLGSSTSVDYATVSGTAVAGENFVAKSGTLDFGANEFEQTITITLIDSLDAPTNLHFAVVLSMPTAPTALGFFASADVVLYNTNATPLNNVDDFVAQTFQDLLYRAPTSAELSAGASYINAGIFGDTTLRRAEYIKDQIYGNQTYLNQEAIFPTAGIYTGIVLNLFSVLAQQAVPPTYADLSNATDLWRSENENDRVWRVTQLFAQNVLEIIFEEAGTVERLPAIFTTTIYSLLLLKVPNQDDLDYWAPILGNPVTDQGAYTMIGRMVTESFDPPPVSGMTSFNIYGDNATKINIGMLYAGLWRQQLDLKTFEKKVIDADIPVVGFLDVIWGALNAPAYASRFELSPAQAYLGNAETLGVDWVNTFLGPLYIGEFRWLYSVNHGWLYAAGGGDFDGNYWLYDQQLGWIYTIASAYPFIWRQDEERWLYYVEGTNNPRTFFDAITQEPITVAYSYYLTETDELYAKRLPGPQLKTPSIPCPQETPLFPVEHKQRQGAFAVKAKRFV
ncbi:Calx-beta domain-containing protein [Rubellicoccus peritrichatus]|uniref:Metallophosphoesterase n=1 Tax=Rubellicoccus peritrichatus TaxID=3080537 RepID=A0AAQ3LCV0_9BACT|nr:Calx-beta domain-containing protein [Puniceicoccus sp. CR14]WOO42127.1 metallophosphoesterase [Puniceicoccus sp. CR14]